MNQRGDNQFQCVATLSAREALRYTPAGIPIVAATLQHESVLEEAGIRRQVAFEMQAIAAGQIAALLERTEMGVQYRFRGFMARKSRNSKALVFHLTDIETISQIQEPTNGIR